MTFAMQRALQREGNFPYDVFQLCLIPGPAVNIAVVYVVSNRHILNTHALSNLDLGYHRRLKCVFFIL